MGMESQRLPRAGRAWLVLPAADDLIEVTHHARSREGFARGAVLAALVDGVVLEIEAGPAARVEQPPLLLEERALVRLAGLLDVHDLEMLHAAIRDLVARYNANGDSGRFDQVLELFAPDAVMEIVGEVPTKDLAPARLEGPGTALVELLVLAGLCPSKGQARKDIEGGGVYINNQREAGFQRAVTANDLLFGKHLLLRKGKRNYVVVSAR